MLDMLLGYVKINQKYATEICVDMPKLSFFCFSLMRFDIVGICAATCLGMSNSPQVAPFNSSAGGSYVVRRYSCC